MQQSPPLAFGHVVPQRESIPRCVIRVCILSDDRADDVRRIMPEPAKKEYMCQLHKPRNRKIQKNLQLKNPQLTRRLPQTSITFNARGVLERQRIRIRKLALLLWR